ncbi:MAG: hypothetical protein ACPG06_05585 [Alphaproteobacteria bacterium]
MSEQEAIDALRPFAELARVFPESQSGETWLYNANAVDPVTGARQSEIVNVTLQQARDAREVIRQYEVEQGLDPTLPTLPDIPPVPEPQSLDEALEDKVSDVVSGLTGGRLGNRSR